jgi:hypothetical protein
MHEKLTKKYEWAHDTINYVHEKFQIEKGNGQNGYMKSFKKQKVPDE